MAGLELPLRHSSVGEFFKAKCSWKFGFGPDGRPASASAGAVPGRADLTFEVEVLEVGRGGGVEVYIYMWSDCLLTQHVSPAPGVEGVIQEVAVKKENGNR